MAVKFHSKVVHPWDAEQHVTTKWQLCSSRNKSGYRTNGPGCEHPKGALLGELGAVSTIRDILAHDVVHVVKNESTG
jgi:hypothetical protein